PRPDGEHIGLTQLCHPPPAKPAIIPYERVFRYEGCAAGFIYFPVRDGTPTDTALGKWAQEVVPAVREAIAKA
ncbi:MAG TPA: hypothetical protein VH912_19115, partial [Streptosporangiaceae bacterium]